MLYLSQLLGTPVEDQEGMRIGKVSGVMIPVDFKRRVIRIHEVVHASAR